MKRGAGPVRARMAPEPMKRPVPMAPPGRKIVSEDSCSSLVGESKRTESQELNVSTLETSLKLVMRVVQVVLSDLACLAALLVEVVAIATVVVIFLLSHDVDEFC